MYIIDINGRLINQNSIESKVKRYSQESGDYNFSSKEKREAKGLNYSDCRKILEEMYNKFGLEKVKSFLSKFKVSHLKELREEQYLEFIMEAEHVNDQEGEE